MKKILTLFMVSVLLIATAFFIYVDNASKSIVPILMYHAISDKETAPDLYVTPDIFDKQMRFLAERHYNVVGPDKVVAYMAGIEKMPPNTVMITFDDGYYDFYKNAFPVLKKYNLQAVIFITTDRIGKPSYMNWNELREISDSGLVKVGSHTKSHPWLPTVSVDEKKLNEELVISKDILERGTGKRAEYLCYPNGAFNDVVRDAARAAGYKGAFTTNPKKRSDIHDIYAIRRIKMSSSYDPLIFAGKTSRFYAWFKERR